MRWFVVRHPDTAGVGVIPASALDLHKGLGWLRVSDEIPEGDKDHVDLTQYAKAPDLDAASSPAKPATRKEA